MTQNLNSCRSKLLQRLADGQFHSGEKIGQELGLSRAAISKHVKALVALGLDVYSVTGKGYRLAKPLMLLEHAQICAHLTDTQPDQLAVLNVIDSTNTYIKQLPASPANGFVCLAEAQTAGRGRRGKSWASPYGASLYLSMFWSFAGGYQAIGGLSLVVGIAVVNALEQLGVSGAKLKWPNDIHVQDKKLAGILVEVEGQLEAHCDCIIGVGLNIDMPQTRLDIDQPWTDLSRLSQQPIDRNLLAGAVINELRRANHTFSQQGLAPFIERWMALDKYLNQPVTLLLGDNSHTGIARGINLDGALLVEHDGVLKPYHGGEISVRAG